MQLSLHSGDSVRREAELCKRQQHPFLEDAVSRFRTRGLSGFVLLSHAVCARSFCLSLCYLSLCIMWLCITTPSVNLRVTSGLSSPKWLSYPDSERFHSAAPTPKYLAFLLWTLSLCSSHTLSTWHLSSGRFHAAAHTPVSWHISLSVILLL